MNKLLRFSAKYRKEAEEFGNFFMTITLTFVYQLPLSVYSQTNWN